MSDDGSVGPAAVSTGIERIGDFADRPDLPTISQVVAFNGVVYTCGVIGEPEGDVATQTRQALAKVDALLALGATDRSRILSAQVWLADMDDFAEHNAVWDEWVDPANPPVRACVQARLFDDRLRVELRVIAAQFERLAHGQR